MEKTKEKGKKDSHFEHLPPSREVLKLLEYSEVQSWRALMYAFKGIFAVLERGLIAEGCSVSRFQILFYLYMEGELAAVDIARKLVVTRGNISMFLRRMESDGLVKPKISPGHKRSVYVLTRAGRSFFESIFPEHIKRVRSTAPKLPQDTVKALIEVSRRLGTGSF